MAPFRNLARAGLVGVSLLTSGAQVALAEGAAECSASYENAQVLKQNKEYLSARRELLVCARKCHGGAQHDCADWLAGLERVMPSILIDAKVMGEDRND